jgi:hypothetical protein
MLIKRYIAGGKSIRKIIIGHTYTLRADCSAELTSSLVEKGKKNLTLETGGKFTVKGFGNERTVGKDCQRRTLFDVIGAYQPPKKSDVFRVRAMSETFAKAVNEDKTSFFCIASGIQALIAHVVWRKNVQE